MNEDDAITMITFYVLENYKSSSTHRKIMQLVNEVQFSYEGHTTNQNLSYKPCQHIIIANNDTYTRSIGVLNNHYKERILSLQELVRKVL